MLLFQNPSQQEEQYTYFSTRTSEDFGQAWITKKLNPNLEHQNAKRKINNKKQKNINELTGSRLTE